MALKWVKRTSYSPDLFPWDDWEALDLLFVVLELDPPGGDRYGLYPGGDVLRPVTFIGSLCECKAKAEELVR